MRPARRWLAGSTLLLVLLAVVGASTPAGAASYPNDPYFSKEWHLRRIGAPQAWKTTKGKGITIAVIDTGVDRQDPDLTRNMSPLQYGVDNGSNDGSDICPKDSIHPVRLCHGTFVAGVAAAVTNNALGVAGVAPDAKIMAVRNFGADGASYVGGVKWAADHGAQVINLSQGIPIEAIAANPLGAVVSSPAIAYEDGEIPYATAMGSLVVVSAGNEATPVCSDPAINPAALCVGASDQMDRVAGFSNYGVRVDVVAPGVGIWSTCKLPGVPTDSSHYFCPEDGTSASAPVVSGIAALLMSMGASNVLAATIIRATAKDLGNPGYDTTYGWGRVDAAAAVAMCQQICSGAPAVP